MQNNITLFYPEYGSGPKAIHGVNLIVTSVIFICILPLLIWRRGIQPLKAFSPLIQIVQLLILWGFITYLDLLILIDVARFPCWLDNTLQYIFAYLYFGITSWRVIRVYAILEHNLSRQMIEKGGRYMLYYIRKSLFCDFMSTKSLIIYAIFFGLVHLAEIIIGTIIIVVPYYDINHPERGCNYYAKPGGIDDLLSSAMILVDTVIYVIIMIIFTILILNTRIRDIYGIVRGIFITWSHLVISVIYSFSIRILFTLFSATASGASFIDLNIVSSTAPFCWGITLDIVINILIPALQTFNPIYRTNKIEENINQVKFFLPGSPDSEAITLFKKYSIKELATENILFLEYASRYESGTKNRREIVADIRQLFLDPNCTVPLNTTITIINETISRIPSLSDDLLFLLKDAVYINCFDTFGRFKSTPEYKRFKDKHMLYIEAQKKENPPT